MGVPAPHGMYGYEYAGVDADAYVDGSQPSGTQASLVVQNDPVLKLRTGDLAPLVTCLGLEVGKKKKDFVTTQTYKNLILK